MMTLAEVVEMTKLGLGFPLVQIEIEDITIETVIKRAILEASPYYSEVASTNLVAAQCIHLPDIVGTVVEVVLAPTISAEYSSYDVFKNTPFDTSSRNKLSDIGFYQEDRKLYIDAKESYGASITVRYVKEMNIETIGDPFWLNWIIRCATAHLKVTLGSAYRKYQITEAPFQLNGEELVTEGNTELQELRDEIYERGQGYLLISR